ncbi:MAG: hypothetical protein ACFFD4_09300 [Candidatus Odinarchaeota archaeon]
MMYLVLSGRTVTPVVTSKTRFTFKGCKIAIKNVRRRYHGKLNTGKPTYPYQFKSYLGTVELTCQIKNRQQAEMKLGELLAIRQLGRFQSEGMGVVAWESGCIADELERTRKRSIKIRKGLPHYLPSNVKELLQYALLHDFFNNTKHVSKIYTEPDLADEELVARLKKHHERCTADKLVRSFQKYDQLSAMITRKVRSPRENRYNWKASNKVDFKQLAKELKEVSSNVWNLYRYIYESRELGLLNESLQHGHTSLRNHLLVVANLIVQDYQEGFLE